MKVSVKLVWEWQARSMGLLAPGVVVDTVREAQASAANEQRHSLYKVRRL